MDSRLEVVAHEVNRVAAIRKIIVLIPGTLLFLNTILASVYVMG